MIWKYGKAIVEALILASREPLPVKQVAEIVNLSLKDARMILDELMRDYDKPGRGIKLEEIGGGYILVTRPEYAAYIDRVVSKERELQSLSGPALETLAMIAYNQPMTRQQIEKIRGVSPDRALQTLLDRELIRETGRIEAPGRPILYGTTKEFLRYFGLKSLEDLPPRPQLPAAPDLEATVT